jgi:hypothetical protein
MASSANEVGECEELLSRAIRMHQVRSSDSQPAPRGSPPAVEPVAMPITSAISETGSEAAVMDIVDSEADQGARVTAQALPASVSEAEPSYQTPASNPSPSELTAVGSRSSHSALERVALDPASSLPSAGVQLVPSKPDTTAPATSRAKADPEIPTEVARSLKAEGSASRPIVVRIQYDPAKSKYLATDIKTGFAILRHHDGARLRAICDRMNVQIIDGDGSSRFGAPQPGTLPD